MSEISYMNQTIISWGRNVDKQQTKNYDQRQGTENFHNRSKEQTFPTPGHGSPLGRGRGITTFTKVPADCVNKNSEICTHFQKHAMRRVKKDWKLWRLQSVC